MNRNGYAHPEVLIETEWAAAHLDDPLVRFVEVDVDTTAYDSGHVPGAVGWDWHKDTKQPIRRDIPERVALETLLARSGIQHDTTVIFYGDNHNWFATFAFWLLKMYGHQHAQRVPGEGTRLVDPRPARPGP